MYDQGVVATMRVVFDSSADMRRAASLFLDECGFASLCGEEHVKVVGVNVTLPDVVDVTFRSEGPAYWTLEEFVQQFGRTNFRVQQSWERTETAVRIPDVISLNGTVVHMSCASEAS